jgi:hypothetical protein
MIEISYSIECEQHTPEGLTTAQTRYTARAAVIFSTGVSIDLESYGVSPSGALRGVREQVYYQLVGACNTLEAGGIAVESKLAREYLLARGPDLLRDRG